MIIIAGTITFDPANQAKLEEAFAEMAEASQKEPGCLAYDCWLSRRGPGHVLVFEKWESEEALGAHMQSPLMERFGKLMGEIGVTGVDVKKYTGATEGPLH